MQLEPGGPGDQRTSSSAEPGPPSRRATGIRRPRVAGLVPGRPAAPAPVADVPGALLGLSGPTKRADLDSPADSEATVDPAADDGARDGGVREDGGARDGGAQDDSARDGSARDGGPREDGARDGGAREDGGARAGGAEDHGARDGGAEDDGARDGGAREDDGARDDIAQDEGPAGDEARAQHTGKRQRRRRFAANPAAREPRRPLPLPVLAAALAIMVGSAVFFGVADAQLRGTPAVQNTALVDIGTTAQVSQQVDDALRTIYSFDYTRLDQNEAAARAVITPGFADQFNDLFNQVRQLAPQQQAVVTATVNLSAVKSINGDTAVLLVFLDQQATRAQSGTQPQQLAAAGRLTVTAHLVNGTWKVADVQPR